MHGVLLFLKGLYSKLLCSLNSIRSLSYLEAYFCKEAAKVFCQVLIYVCNLINSYTRYSRIVYNGLEEVRYYYGASPLSVGYGLADAEGKTVIPAIYTYFTPIFSDRIIADARNGFGMMNANNIYDIEGNLLCEKYHMVIYKHMNSETDEWLGIGYVAGPESQIESVCRDENGNLMTPGHRFIDKDGNELSEVFTDDIKDEISSKDPIMTLTFADGTVKEVDLTDYVFKP